MGTALLEALDLLFSGSHLLADVVSTTLRMSLSSSLAALLLGVPLGVFLGGRASRIKRALIVVNRTLMGLPPVVCGLLCYLMFCGVGPFRHLELLFTVAGMVVAQVLLITPIVAGTIEPFVASIYPAIYATTRGLGISGARRLLLIVNESLYQVVSAYLLALSRGLAEVGAVSMVGGAIAYKTNIMTTAIMNYTNMGNFTTALALGIILLTISLVINVVFSVMQGRLRR